MNPLGIKGIGEIGIVGTSAAVANAVYHATGQRLRRPSPGASTRWWRGHSPRREIRAVTSSGTDQLLVTEQAPPRRRIRSQMLVAAERVGAGKRTR